jgi:hypothetical protein
MVRVGRGGGGQARHGTTGRRFGVAAAGPPVGLLTTEALLGQRLRRVVDRSFEFLYAQYIGFLLVERVAEPLTLAKRNPFAFGVIILTRFGL